MSHDPAAHEDGLSILDPRFPIRCAEPPVLFWQLAREWEDRDTVLSVTARASQRDAVAQERFVRRTVEETMPAMRAIPAAGPVYAELTPASLDRDDEMTRTIEGVYTLSDVPSPTGRKRGSDGRFLPEAV